MKTRILQIATALLALVGTTAHAACQPSAPALSPSNVTMNATSGDPAQPAITTLTIDCYYGESAQVFAAQDVYKAAVGNTADAIEGRLYSDSGLSSSLHSNPIVVTGSDPGASPNRVNNTIYLRLSGPGGGNLASYGSFSLSMPLELRSDSTTPIMLTVSGTINGACSINNASVDFGQFTTGTKPIRPVGLTINCTQGLPWSMSQPAITFVGPTKVNDNTAWVASDAGGRFYLMDTPIVGTGTGTGQNVPAYVVLNGPTSGSPTVGTGTISGTISILLSY